MLFLLVNYYPLASRSSVGQSLLLVLSQQKGCGYESLLVVRNSCSFPVDGFVVPHDEATTATLDELAMTLAVLLRSLMFCETVIYASCVLAGGHDIVSFLNRLAFEVSPVLAGSLLVVRWVSRLRSSELEIEQTSPAQ